MATRRVLLSQAMAPANTEEDELAPAVREHARLVYRIAYSVLRNHHDAEDATQETFLRVLRYRQKLAMIEDQKAWLARVAWRVAVDRGKKRRSRPELTLEEKPLETVASSQASATDAMQNSQLSIHLENLIATLPERLREPLTLSSLEEMSPRDVAATLGINEAAVRSRVFRAKQILREKFARLARSRRS